MQKKVVFDLLFAQEIGGTKFHGGGEYMKTVFHALSDRYHCEYVLTVCYDTERFIDDWIVEVIKNKNIQVHDSKSAADIVSYICREAEISDINFFAGMVYPYDKFDFPKNVTCIGTCHGLRTLEKTYDKYAVYYINSKESIKEFIKATFLKKIVIERAVNMYEKSLRNFGTVITASEHSAYSIRVNFPELMKNKRITVCYTPEKYIVPFEKKETEKERYIMMVSANRWLKNSYRGVKALDGLYQKGYLKGIKTKVFGNLPKSIKKKIKNKDCFEFFSYVSTEELEQAYCDCEIFFYPTLNEGFGLPPMEAMKYGKTCVISGICSLPEVYGNSVYYCNPYDIMEMQNRILQGVDHPINKDTISAQMNNVHERQNQDLDKLCNIIIS